MKKSALLTITTAEIGACEAGKLAVLQERFGCERGIFGLLGAETAFSLQGWDIWTIQDVWPQDYQNNILFFDKMQMVCAYRIEILSRLLREYDEVIALQPTAYNVALEISIPNLAPDSIAQSFPSPHPDTSVIGVTTRNLPDDFYVFTAGTGMNSYLQWCLSKIEYTLRYCNGAIKANIKDDPVWGFFLDWISSALYFPLRVSMEFPRNVMWTNAREEELENDYPYDFFKDGTRISKLLRNNYVRNYRLRHRCDDLPYKNESILLDQNDLLMDDHPVPLTPVMREIFASRRDLREAFGEDLSGDKRLPFVEWFLHFGKKEYGLDERYFTEIRKAYENYRLDGSARTRIQMRQGRFRLKKNVQDQNRIIDETLPEGVNLCGFIKGQFGLAEAVRIGAAILETAGIPFTIIDFEAPKHEFTDDTWSQKIGTRFVYNTNLLWTNMDHIKAFQSDVDLSAFEGRYNIGYWVWELEEFPKHWLSAYDPLDEVWTASDFVRDNFAAHTQKPVRTIPHAISISKDENCSRCDFGIPDNAFVFLMSYDVLSTAGRKNPIAAVKAFLKAFPEGDPSVRLLIKINTHGVIDSENDLLEMIKDTPNIDVLIGTYPKEKMNSLIACCDAYVSLHRSEGFGLGPAEAMYFGKPAILTNWSGNTIYMTEDNCCPVDYKLIELERDYPPYPKGARWADADVDQAAEYMKRLVSDKAYYAKIAENAEKTIKESFSKEAIAEKVIARLKELGLYR